MASIRAGLTAMSAKRAAVCPVLVGAVIASVACSEAAATAGDVKRKLTGDWRLTEFSLRAPDGTLLSHPFGADAHGKLTYTRDGTMWALVRSHDRSATLWYTGGFRIKPKHNTIAHDVRYASLAEWEGTVQRRRFVLTRCRLTLAVPQAQPLEPIATLEWIRSSCRRASRLRPGSVADVPRTPTVTRG